LPRVIKIRIWGCHAKCIKFDANPNQWLEGVYTNEYSNMIDF